MQSAIFIATITLLCVVSAHAAYHISHLRVELPTYRTVSAEHVSTDFPPQSTVFDRFVAKYHEPQDEEQPCRYDSTTTKGCNDSTEKSLIDFTENIVSSTESKGKWGNHGTTVNRIDVPDGKQFDRNSLDLRIHKNEKETKERDEMKFDTSPSYLQYKNYPSMDENSDELPFRVPTLIKNKRNYFFKKNGGRSSSDRVRKNRDSLYRWFETVMANAHAKTLNPEKYSIDYLDSTYPKYRSRGLKTVDTDDHTDIISLFFEPTTLPPELQLENSFDHVGSIRSLLDGGLPADSGCHINHLMHCGVSTLNKLQQTHDERKKCQIRTEFLDCMQLERETPCNPMIAIPTGTPEDAQRIRSQISRHFRQISCYLYSVPGNRL